MKSNYFPNIFWPQSDSNPITKILSGMQALSTFPQPTENVINAYSHYSRTCLNTVQRWTSPYNRRAWANVSFSVNIEWLTAKHARGTTQTHSKRLCDKQRRKQKHISVEVIIRHFCTPPPLGNVINDRRRRVLLIDSVRYRVSTHLESNVLSQFHSASKRTSYCQLSVSLLMFSLLSEKSLENKTVT